MTGWKNRIVGTGTVRPQDVTPHPMNWRRHPDHQKHALSALLDEVGWVDHVVINRRTGHVVDGHLRLELAKERGEAEVPALFVDLSEEEELAVLATLDPIAAMATSDADKIAELLELAEQTDVLDLITHVFHPTAPEDHATHIHMAVDGESDTSPPSPDETWEEMGMPPFDNPTVFNPYHTIKVHFQDEAALAEFSRLVGQNVSNRTKYIWFPKQDRENLKAYAVDLHDDGRESR